MTRLAAAFDEPFTTHGTELHVTASIGVAVSGGADHPAALIHAADAAMYRAKHELEGDHPKPAAPAFPTAVSTPKLEQLISRLLDLLSSGREVESPATVRARLQGW